MPINGFIADSASSPPKLAMWRTESEALGLLALQEPTPQQLLTTNGGRQVKRLPGHSGLVQTMYRNCGGDLDGGGTVRQLPCGRARGVANH